jgi:hypothetical protein
MYIGADVDRIIAALSGLSGEDPQVALAAVLQSSFATDLPGASMRWRRIARSAACGGPAGSLDARVNLPPEFGFPRCRPTF